MEFFVENWIWFLVAGIVLLMTLIGYIAEKTDFGRKDVPVRTKNKKEKTEKSEEDIELDEADEKEVKPEVQMTLATDSILENEENSDTNKEDEEVLEELKVPFGDTEVEKKDKVEEIVDEEPTEELSLDDAEVPNIELPDLETIVSEEIDDDDDIWRF